MRCCTIFASILALALLPSYTMSDQTLFSGLGSLQSLPSYTSFPNMPQYPTNMKSIIPGFQSIMPQAQPVPVETEKIPCSCGVFLSGQIHKRTEPPTGNPALLQELTDNFQCNNAGDMQCVRRCFENIVRYLPSSPAIICGGIDRDITKERAYLFVKNCNNKWINSNMSAGREYCCKDGVPQSCTPS